MPPEFSSEFPLLAFRNQEFRISWRLLCTFPEDFFLLTFKISTSVYGENFTGVPPKGFFLMKFSWVIAAGWFVQGSLQKGFLSIILLKKGFRSEIISAIPSRIPHFFSCAISAKTSKKSVKKSKEMEPHKKFENKFFLGISNF